MSATNSTIDLAVVSDETLTTAIVGLSRCFDQSNAGYHVWIGQPVQLVTLHRLAREAGRRGLSFSGALPEAYARIIPRLAFHPEPALNAESAAALVARCQPTTYVAR
jgi:hypothetical protein